MKPRLPNDAIAAFGAFALTGLAMIGSVAPVAADTIIATQQRDRLAVSDYRANPLFVMLEIGA